MWLNGACLLCLVPQDAFSVLQENRKMNSEEADVEKEEENEKRWAEVGDQVWR